MVFIFTCGKFSTCLINTLSLSELFSNGYPKFWAIVLLFSPNNNWKGASIPDLTTLPPPKLVSLAAILTSKLNTVSDATEIIWKVFKILAVILM